ncbi:30S ribosomal protein S12 methylthiotransferase RimO [Actinopolymorpha singaporensis]|uniref:Ribosomal protein uS12 methylthiotransferase RimO n=1 Tax=Actinopolymorpha singaporensis TaxID=117157 RepID=A0A1H1XTA6_9ACTN|nr:30S ribosomal protein S12 methylthiotransferase RimO [Actinopolymorpha singaporensis]SDT12455.1 ribosomal protein S12 methylthiotransferase RimO [Actinopolymorpha singaporensis]
MTAPSHAHPTAEATTTVAVVTLGCARNEVDSEELAGRLAEGGFTLVEDAESADAVLVNTCGFIETAKKDSVDQLLGAADLKADGGRTQAVVAVGCLAERYGEELARELPEADAVLSFDDYPDIADRVRTILTGAPHVPHAPRDRRKLLPISPAARGSAAADSTGAGGAVVPGHRLVTPDSRAAAPDLPAGIAPASGPRVHRRRLGGGPVAPLKLASGCDRRCAFCAIPRFRGAFISRPPEDVLAEAGWLAGHGVRELFLVSENSTSYGKDLGDLRLLETSLLPELAAVDGIERVRVSYLQPAEMRPGLVEAMATVPGVAAYFDLSFQHASPTVLRRMRRFGDTERFLGLIEQIRAVAPEAGIRSNVIVGFPGENERDVEELCEFLEAARLDVVGVFGYSDEDGTEALGYDGKLDEDEIAARAARVGELAEELTAQRAEDRIGEVVDVLVESVEPDGSTGADSDLPAGSVEGRAAHQGPEVDGTTRVVGASGARAGDFVRALVVDTEGVDLVAEALQGAGAGAGR